jgi:hypothetical protein
MTAFCSCPNPQSCVCRASQPEPARWQEYHSGYQQPFSPFPSSQTPLRSQAPSSYSPFTPRSRGPPTQHHYASAYNTYASYDHNHTVPFTTTLIPGTLGIQIHRLVRGPVIPFFTGRLHATCKPCSAACQNSYTKRQCNWEAVYSVIVQYICSSKQHAYILPGFGTLSPLTD